VILVERGPDLGVGEEWEWGTKQTRETLSRDYP
jgi:hypothetical protein